MLRVYRQYILDNYQATDKRWTKHGSCVLYFLSYGCIGPHTFGNLALHDMPRESDTCKNTDVRLSNIDYAGENAHHTKAVSV